MNLRREKTTPILPTLLGIAALCAFSSSAFADAAADCQKQIDRLTADLNKYQKQKDDAHAQADALSERIANDHVDSLVRAISSKQSDCDTRAREDQDQIEKNAAAERSCNDRREGSKDKDGNSMWQWSKTRKKCINLVGSKDLPDNDECGSASVFESLKGKNCKKAMNVIKETSSRSSAITEATTAFTGAYAGQQAMGVTNQEDAQAAQQKALQFAAYAKLASAANNLTSAMQLKSAAAGAADASSTITEAQKGLAAKCPGGTSDDQACFFQNARDFGITADQSAYASFDRMRTGSRQSQDQADAANLAAKGSMISGLADTLVGIQALKMAQMAGQNAQGMAPPPLMRAPPAPGMISLGGGGPMPGPALAPAPSQGPTDYGNPTDGGPTFGGQNHARINGGLVKGNMGPPSAARPASSGVSGGGGAGSTSGGSGARGGSPGRGRGSNHGTGVGEYNLAGAGGVAKGGGAAEKGDGSNPFAEALAKLFPQNPNGTPVVDTRQLSSGDQAVMAEETESEGQVMAADLSIFEQISAKYRQLNGSGRF